MLCCFVFLGKYELETLSSKRKGKLIGAEHLDMLNRIIVHNTEEETQQLFPVLYQFSLHFSCQ